MFNESATEEDVLARLTQEEYYARLNTWLTVQEKRHNELKRKDGS